MKRSLALALLFVVANSLACDKMPEDDDLLKLTKRAKLLIGTHKPDSIRAAIGILDYVLKVDSLNFDLYYGKVRALWLLADYGSVIGVLDTAIERCPDQEIMGLFLQGVALDYLGRTDEAKDRYSKYLAGVEQLLLLAPKDVEVTVSRAFALCMLGRKSDAIDAMERLWNERPKDEYVIDMLDQVKKFDRFEFLSHYSP